MNEAHPVRLNQSQGQGKRPVHGLLPGREPGPQSGPGGDRKDLDRQKRSLRIEVEVENPPRRGVRQQRGQAEAPGDLPLQVRRLEPGIERHEQDLSVRPDVDGPVAHAIAPRAHLIDNSIVGKHGCAGKGTRDSPAPKSLPSRRPPVPRLGIRSLPLLAGGCWPGVERSRVACIMGPVREDPAMVRSRFIQGDCPQPHRVSGR